MAIPRALAWVLRPGPGKELDQAADLVFSPRELLTGAWSVPDEGPSQGGKGGLQGPCASWSLLLSPPALSGSPTHQLPIAWVGGLVGLPTPVLRTPGLR